MTPKITLLHFFFKATQKDNWTGGQNDKSFMLICLLAWKSLRIIKAWVKNDYRLQCPPSKVRGIRVDCASNHSYLESRSRSSWTASAILKCRLCIGFSHLRWWIRQSRGRHQKKVITFSLLSSFPQKMTWYRCLKAK